MKQSTKLNHRENVITLDEMSNDNADKNLSHGDDTHNQDLEPINQNE